MPEDPAFETLAGKYIEKYLELYPERATALGEHRYDHRLNDYSAAGLRVRLDFHKKFQKSLRKIDSEQLTPINRIDYFILKNQLEKSIFRLEVLEEHQWNPLVYNIGGAIYNLIARDFAPLDERMANLKERLVLVPRVTAMAKANLNNPPKVHTETAILQNKGTMNLIENELEEFIDQISSPDLKREINVAREKAVDALRYYGSWLENDLLPESNGDFRLGKKNFEKKLRLTLDSDMRMSDILRQAEVDLLATQTALFDVAAGLHIEYWGPVDESATPELRKRVIKRVLDRLAESRPDNETIVEKAQSRLEDCTAFVAANDLVRVPDEPVELIVMPEFQRGVAVAYCDAPGPLEPEGRTFYAISPTPADWSDERVTSFFREYNDFMLDNLTIHEAMPGHYLQLAHANRFEAPTRIRAVFASGPFVEGWATYAEQLMVESGYGGPELKMQQLKMRLRMIINAIIDQRIHTDGMTEEEAMMLMMEEGFQEEGEAAGKWRRACLTSAQLSTYYVGNIEVNEIRRAYEAKNGADFDQREFHDKLLSFGSPPPRHLEGLMGL
ncbi:MAG: DUF885 domain-containing protein [Candidatus Latescibacterota bacterium]|nr:MAG: DUF885 domain-containing protein [Candidatus Latescibacterota bacterium]